MRGGGRVGALAGLLVLGGCLGGIRGTTTVRTSTEMLLVSGAAEQAIRRWDASDLAGRRVLLDVQFLECMDEPYVTSALRYHLARAGAVLADAAADAERIVEVRCASLGTWEGDWKVGVPPLPLSFGGPTVLGPDLTFGISSRQGWAKLEVFVRDAASGDLVSAPPPLWGAAREELLRSVYPSVLETAKGALAERAPDDPGAEWLGTSE